MGTNVSSQSNQQNTQTFKIQIDLTKQISSDLKQLVNWSLQQIRDIYAAFRRRKSSPILNRTEFARLISLSRTSSFYLYPLIAQKNPLTVFVVMSLMVLTSYSNLHYKLHFLCLMFDFCGRSSLKLSEMKLLYRSVVRGYCLLTKQPCPKTDLLDKYSRVLYSKSDINDNQFFQISEVVELIENNPHALQLFMRFQSTTKIKQQYHIFNKFSSYSQKEGHFINQLSLDIYEDSGEMDRFVEGNWSKIRNQSLLAIDQSNFQNQFMTPSKSRSQSIEIGSEDEKDRKRNKSQPNNFANRVIIIKGKSITRKQIFKLKDYFDSLSSGYTFISLSQFMQAFSGDKFDHMKSITASLFNFLDRRQSGKISFFDLLFKIYPSLSTQQISIIKVWVKQYQKMFSSQKKFISQKKQQQKKKLLPKNCITRVREIFALFDREKKGWVSLDNLKVMFKESFTEKEVVEMFNQKDLDRDGRLNLEEFIRVLLPNDVSIEGLQGSMLPSIGGGGERVLREINL